MKKLFKILSVTAAALFMLFLFLIAPRTVNKADMSPFKGTLWAHRGMYDLSAGIPENSLPAFENAIKHGCGIELDVTISRDNVPMVIHDADLERLTGVKGKVWEYTSQQLQQMKLQGTEHTIPTLRQAMETIDGRVPVLVEYKMDLVDTVVCEKGNMVLENYEGDYCIQCYDPRALLWYRQNVPHIARGQLSREFWKDEKYKGSRLYTAMSFMVGNVVSRPDFIAYDYQDRSNISLQLCRLMGADTACYTLYNDNDLMSAKEEFDMYIFGGFIPAGLQ